MKECSPRTSAPERDNHRWLRRKVPTEPDLLAWERVQDAVSSEGGSSSLTDSITCQVEIIIPTDHEDDPSSCWYLQSFNLNGEEKAIGGDEYYITYHEPDESTSVNQDDPRTHLGPTAVARAVDLSNGLYRLDFSTNPVSPSPPWLTKAYIPCSGWLTIYLEFSDGVGSLHPPSKDMWKNGGYTHVKWEAKNLPCRPRPIRRFCPPSNSLCLNNFSKVLVFGDSTFDQLVRQRPNNKGKYMFQPNIVMGGDRIRMALTTRTVQDFMRLIEDQHGVALESICKDSNVALIVGSAMWDLLASTPDDCTARKQPGCSYFDSHAEACRLFVQELERTYPSVTIIWKLPTHVHIHWVDLHRIDSNADETIRLLGINRIRYMSGSRSRQLYHVQKDCMSQLGIQVLDVYEATYLAAFKLYPSDGRHFRPEFNRMLLSWFYDKSLS